MYYSNILLFLLVLVIALSCTTSSLETTAELISIDIENGPKTDNPEYEVDLVRIIPLETTDESIFGVVNRIEVVDGRIYILDIQQGKGIYVFHENGDFIGRTKNGKGPGEMLNPFAFYVDHVENRLVVWDQSLSSLFEFDYNFVLKNKIRSELFIDDINSVQGGKLVHFEDEKKGANTFALFSDELEKLIYFQDFSYDSKHGSQYLDRSISVGSETLLITPNHYFIYGYDEKVIKPKYEIDFKEKSLREEDLKEGVEQIWERILGKEKVSFPLSVFESHRFIGFNVMYGHEYSTFLINKSTNELIQLADFIGSPKLPKCRILGSMGQAKDLFYGLIEPRDLIKFHEENRDVELMPKDSVPQPNDNPLLILLDIK